ncbi:NADH oxidase [Labrenzia sp. THAF82]|uniref:oxidoreductase n=1 Tax=Labrenzia sp. THAF82 TaxID=2587861 RepID=UPI001267D5F4|nr:NADH:flavin oxidoreductase [Labrenzia sp. THAF82]QFT32666.1 NADH oxidase [Labrenzia sp. THAF82]
MSNQTALLSPATIGSKSFSNRLVLAPMSRTSAEPDGTPTAEMASYYAGFARGGFGLLIAEGAFVDANYSQCYGNQPGLVTDSHEAGWRTVVEAVKRENGKIILQLIHAGAVSQFVERAFAPSPVRPMGEMLQGYGPRQGPYDTPGELSVSDIRAICSAFVDAAKRAEAAGFDGVEIHCANGYLLDQFLTPETNLRNDTYGGTLEDRLRLTTDILSMCQQKTSPDFLVGVRLSQAKATVQDYFWPNGLEDARVIFSAVAEAGANFIHLASEKGGYTYHSTTKTGENLTAFARSLTGLPVIANGGLQDIGLANQVIADQLADFVSIGKAAMLNPDLPKKIASGAPLRDFTFEMFKYGVSVNAQLKWEAEQRA